MINIHFNIWTIQYILFDWWGVKAQCSQSLPCVWMYKHMHQPCYSKLQPQVYGMELQSLASIFAYWLKGGFWQAVRRQVFETQGKGGVGEEWGREASADHTIRTTQTLSSLKCHSCDQPFHLWGALQHSCHTRSFEAQTFQPIRTFNSDNLYASVIFPTSPAPRTAAAEGFHFCSLHEMPRALGPNWKTAYGKARRTGRAKNWKELLESH